MVETISTNHERSALFTRNSIICISHGFQPNYERGFCNGLAANQVTLTLISSDRTDLKGIKPEVRCTNLRGTQDVAKPIWIKAFNLIRYHIALSIYVALRPKSVLHVIGLIDPPILCGIIEGLWFRLVSKQYVVTIHNLLPHDSCSSFKRLILFWSYRIPHRLVVHTTKMKNELNLRFRIKFAKITVMEHGIEPMPEDRTGLRSVNERNSTPVILMFGVIWPYKGVDVLLEALMHAQFKFNLVIAGLCVHQKYRERLNSLIMEHPFKESITWHDGYIEESKMEQLFREADLVTLPYRHIDQSGVLFQALRFGVPVIATRVGQFEEIITNEVGEIASADDVEDLALALDRWAQRWPDFSRSQIREIGRAYEWQKTVISLSDTYQG